MRRTTALLTAALLATIGLAGCGDDGDEFTEANLADKLVEQNLFDQETSECVAASVFEELDEDELQDVEDSFDDAGDLPPALQDALTTAVTACVDVEG